MVDAKTFTVIIIILLAVIGILGYQVWQLSVSEERETRPVITSPEDVKENIDNMATQLQSIASELKNISQTI